MFKKINPREIAESATKKFLEVVQSNLFQYVVVGHAILYFVFMLVFLVGLALKLVR